MPHRKLQRAAETVRKKRRRREAKKRKQQAIKAAERQRRRRRIERNEPKNLREEAAATVKQAKELGSEVVQTAREEFGRGTGGGGKDTVEDTDRRPAPLTSLPHVGETTAERLRQAGFTRPRDVRNASVAELHAVPGIGDVKARQILEAAGGTVQERQEQTAPQEQPHGFGGDIPDFSFGDEPGIDESIPDIAGGGDSGDDDSAVPDFGSIDLGLDDE